MPLWARSSMRDLPTMKKPQATLTPHSSLVRSSALPLFFFSLMPFYSIVLCYSHFVAHKPCIFFKYVFHTPTLSPTKAKLPQSLLAIKPVSGSLKCKPMGPATWANIWSVKTEATVQRFGKGCLGKDCCFRPSSLYEHYCYPPRCQTVFMEKAYIKTYSKKLFDFFFFFPLLFI